METHLKSTLVNKQLIGHLRLNFFMEKEEKKKDTPLRPSFPTLSKVIQYYFFPTRRQFLNQ